jgi:hypothetical protein
VPARSTWSRKREGGGRLTGYPDDMKWTLLSDRVIPKTGVITKNTLRKLDPNIDTFYQGRHSPLHSSGTKRAWVTPATWPTQTRSTRYSRIRIRDIDGLRSVAGWRAGGGLFDLRKGCNARPPAHICLEDHSYLPGGTGEFEGVAFMALNSALPGVIFDG